LSYSLDDLHNSFWFTGYYEASFTPPWTLRKTAPRHQDFYNNLVELADMCERKVPYRTLDSGKIGIIYIEDFDIETPTEFESNLNALLDLGTVESIVIDLTCNTGGVIASMQHILGFLTDEPISYFEKDAIGGRETKFVKTSDNVAIDVDWYILSSPISYSASNWMMSVAQEMNIATIIGQDSEGGSCYSQPIFTMDGSGIFISSVLMLSDSRFITTEYGITVDILMDDFNDNVELVSVVNGN
jgi:C-terminal processing protease CtpA/Prc